MGDDIAIDLDRLDATAANVRELADHFDAAEGVAEDIGGLTGHDGLAGRIADFGDHWDNARTDLRDNLRYVADFLQAIVDTYRDLDLALADGLETEDAS